MQFRLFTAALILGAFVVGCGEDVAGHGGDLPLQPEQPEGQVVQVRSIADTSVWMGDQLQLELDPFFKQTEGRSIVFEGLRSNDGVQIGLVGARRELLVISPLRVGASEIRVTASDSLGSSDSLSFLVRVLPECAAPALGEADYFPLQEGRTWSYEYERVREEYTHNLQNVHREAWKGTVEWQMHDLTCSRGTTFFRIREEFSGSHATESGFTGSLERTDSTQTWTRDLRGRVAGSTLWIEEYAHRHWLPLEPFFPIVHVYGEGSEETMEIAASPMWTQSRIKLRRDHGISFFEARTSLRGERIEMVRLMER